MSKLKIGKSHAIQASEVLYTLITEGKADSLQKEAISLAVSALHAISEIHEDEGPQIATYNCESCGKKEESTILRKLTQHGMCDNCFSNYEQRSM